MAKLYAHTPVEALVQDFLSHLNINEPTETTSSKEEGSNTGFMAIILSPVEGTKSFRQILPLFIKKLSKRFKSVLKATGTKSKITWSWDEDLVIVLESLEDFINMSWQVTFFRDEQFSSAPITDFRSPMFSMGIGEDIYVNMTLLTRKEDNAFKISTEPAIEAAQSLEETNLDDGTEELVIEEVSKEKAAEERAKLLEAKKEEARIALEEFAELRGLLDKELEGMRISFVQKGWRYLLTRGTLVLRSLDLANSNNTREQQIYLTETKIETVILMGKVYAFNKDGEKAKALVSPMITVAKRGPVEHYVEMLVLLGDIEYLLEDYEESMKAYSLALSSRMKFEKDEKIYINAKRAKTAIKFEETEALGYVNMSAEEGFKYLKYAIDHTTPGTESHSLAVHAVCDVMFKKGQIGGAAHTCLLSLVKDSKNPDLRKQFATFLQTHHQLVPSMLEMLVPPALTQQVSAQDSNDNQEQEDSRVEEILSEEEIEAKQKKLEATASSVHFIAQILKEHSAIEEADTFFSKACELTEFKTPRHVLGYMNILDIKRNPEKLMMIVNKYLDASINDEISIILKRQAFVTEDDVDGSQGFQTLEDLVENIKKQPSYSDLVEKIDDDSIKYTFTNKRLRSMFEKARTALNTYLSNFRINMLDSTPLQPLQGEEGSQIEVLIQSFKKKRHDFPHDKAEEAKAEQLKALITAAKEAETSKPTETSEDKVSKASSRENPETGDPAAADENGKKEIRLTAEDTEKVNMLFEALLAERDDNFLKLQVDGNLDPVSALTCFLVNSPVNNSIQFPEASLQILAITLTLVKSLYLREIIPNPNFNRSHGKDVLADITSLINLTEPIRVCVNDLHRTPLRNDQAYYNLISKSISHKLANRKTLLHVIEGTTEFNLYQLQVEEQKKENKKATMIPYFSEVEDKIKRVYVLGGSHILPLSWQVLNRKNVADCLSPDEDLAMTEIIPIHCPGTKIWHLREESHYFTKSAFNSSVQFIQRHFKSLQKRCDLVASKKGFDSAYCSEKAKVVFMFGELDCDEGLAIALERGKFETLEEAADSLAEVYCSVLQSVVKKYDFEIFVHPILPSSRDLVKTFNSKLEARVKKLQKKSKGKVKWLKFVEQIVDEEGELKEEFKLDGSHLDPTYVNLFKDQILD